MTHRPHPKEVRLIADRYGLTAAEARHLATHPRVVEIRDQHERWLMAHGYPAPSSSLSRGKLLEMMGYGRAANPRPRFRNGLNDLGGGVKVWVSGDVPTSVTSSGDLRGRALAKKISDWLGVSVYLSNARWENGNYRADVSIDPLMRSNPQPWARVFG